MNHGKPDQPQSLHTDVGRNGTEEAIDLGLRGGRQTELDQLLLTARREFFAAEGRFLDRDELDRELAERRGGSIAVGEE